MNACIFYHPEAYTTSQEKLMGRNSAGESFLKGFIKYSTSSEFWGQIQEPSHAALFESSVRSLGRSEPVHAVNKTNLGELARAQLLFLPGPGISKHAFHRGLYGHAYWSLCGITHTTSSAGAMDALAELITTPVQPWDAVICTSEAVKNNVTQLLQAQADYLQDRLGITKLQLPQLPVIPLGIHTQEFEYTAEQKSAARTKLGIQDEEFAVLYMGRLSFHAKAHPLALYQSLEAASQRTQKKIVLVECGWFANNHIEQAFADAASLACPSVRIIKLDGRIADSRAAAWAAADVFSSLVDNIQETFGITPIEAMAAGLPAVVSDWNGYKDTVRSGIDGFRVPTIMPQAGLGRDLAFRHALEIDNYDIYCGYTCSFIAVDIEVATQSFVELINSPDLCKQMGQNGKDRAREIFDWSRIIPRYEALWSELHSIRLAMSKDLNPIQNIWPARLDPFHSFSSYPSHQLILTDEVEVISSDPLEVMERISRFKQLRMINFADRVLLTDEEMRRVVELSCGGKTPISELLSIFPADRQPFILRGLLWLFKVGVMKKSG